MKKSQFTLVLWTIAALLFGILYFVPKPTVVLVRPASEIELPDIYITTDDSLKMQFEAIEVQE